MIPTPHTPAPRPFPVACRPPAPGATVTPLLAARATEPEDVPVAAVQGTLALDLGLRPAPSPVPEPRLLLVGADDDGDREVQMWAARFAQAVVEVVAGDRPLPQLLRWTTARIYNDLSRRVRILARTSVAPQRMRTVRAQVRSVHVCRPGADCAEVSVHVRHGQRSRAIAARLERRNGHWTCTALQLG